MYLIENWSVVGSVYTAPEARNIRIHGNVYGHSLHKDGTPVITSEIVKVNGKEITTRNNIYKLGDPEKDYINWMKENNIKFDPENPIKITNINKE
jgi:hypothetical protein